MRKGREVIIEDSEGNELGRGTLAGIIEDGATTAIFVHADEREKS